MTDHINKINEITDEMARMVAEQVEQGIKYYLASIGPVKTVADLILQRDELLDVCKHLLLEHERISLYLKANTDTPAMTRARASISAHSPTTTPNTEGKQVSFHVPA